LGWSIGRIVLINGVLVLNGSLAPLAWACSINSSNKNRALSYPCSSRVSSIESSHSCVSWGSISLYGFDNFI